MPKNKNPGNFKRSSSNPDETALKGGNEETRQIESPRGSAQSESSGGTEQLEALTLKAPDEKRSSEKNLMEESGSSPFLLDEWMKAIERLKKTDPKIYMTVEDYANKQWASHIADELEVADEPLELINNYLDFLAGKGIISRKDFNSEIKGGDIIITISGKYPLMIRGGNFFTYLIELVSGKIFDYEEKASGNSLKLILSPGVFTLKVAIALKVGRGSIKVSSKDLDKLDMDIIENVTLLPLGKDTGIAEMMSSDSKVSAGFVIMNARDANLIGIREGDKVELIKKEDENSEEKGESGQEKESGEDTGKVGHEEGEGNQPENKEDEEEGVGKGQQKEDGEIKNVADPESNKENPGKAEKETASEKETADKEQDKDKEQNDDEQQEGGDLKNEEAGAKSQINSEISSQSKNPNPAKGPIAQKPKQQRSQVQAQKQKQQPKQQPIQKPKHNEQQKAAKKDTKKPGDKTKQMLDFEAKIDALRNN
jgi:hypothetical protein